MGFLKRDEKGIKSVYLNRPIQKKEEDHIGISTYVEKLNEAIEEGAKIIAVTSDFGTGKSSLISLYKNIYENKFQNIICGKGKKVICINMWGKYAHMQREKQQNGFEISGNEDTIQLELHKAFIYQVISQINSKDNRKSSYISRRLSKDFGIFSISGKSKLWSFISIVSIIGFCFSTIAYKYQEYIQKFLGVDERCFIITVVSIFVLSVLGFGFAIANSEITFSSKKSEGNRRLDENILIDIFKQEVMNHCGWQHYIIVIEDLDRIDEKDSVLQFLRELRKYYLTEGGRHKISFVVCIKPEASLQNIFQKEEHEYKKIFDYSINLQKINIDNYDSILKGLLEEKKQWIEELNLSSQIEMPGMEWMIHGQHIDIREVKNRLNESLTLYESLINRFPQNENKAVIDFERCAVATYLRREYEEDFCKLEDDALDVLVSQFAIRGFDTIDNSEQPDSWNQLSEKFKKEIVRLIKDKKIDANYRLYFYNYPSDSKLFTVSEMRVYNSIVYQETPKNHEEYYNHLDQTSERVILEAYRKISTLGVRMPLFLVDYDKLFVLLYINASEKFFDLIESQKFDKNNEERICNLIEKCVKEREGEYEREILICRLAQHLNNVVEDKNILCAIRQRMCTVIPDKAKQFESLFMGDNPFITSEEIAALGDGNEILDVINYDMMDEDTTSVDDIHQAILNEEEWNQKRIEFYLKCVEIQGMNKWRDALANACEHFGEIPEAIVDVYEKEIKENSITLDNYVDCIEKVSFLEKRQLQILEDYHWVEGLSKRLCDLMYKSGFYLEYLCNAILLDPGLILFEDENIVNVIGNDIDWIQKNAEKSFCLIRKSVLQNHIGIEKFDFLFMKPYPVLSEQELSLIESAEDAITLLEGRCLTEEQSVYLVNYFNRRYRKSTTAYKIISFILRQEEEMAKELLYRLDLSNIPYARMARTHRKEINEQVYELFQMEEKPEERVKFLSYTGVPVEEMEKELWNDLNQDDEIRKIYVKYVNQLEKIPGYTLKNITHLNSTDIYSSVVNQRLWEYKAYETYVSSKTALEKRFEMEEDKLDELWPVYIKMFHSPNRERTRGYMIKNKSFMRKAIEQKTYMDIGDSILYYAQGKQSIDLLNYVFENYNVTIQRTYFSEIDGFDGYDAAHRFCELAKEHSIIAEDENVYANVKGKLINPGLEGWFTKICKHKK